MPFILGSLLDGYLGPAPGTSDRFRSFNEAVPPPPGESWPPAPLLSSGAYKKYDPFHEELLPCSRRTRRSSFGDTEVVTAEELEPAKKDPATGLTKDPTTDGYPELENPPSFEKPKISPNYPEPDGKVAEDSPPPDPSVKRPAKPPDDSWTETTNADLVEKLDPLSRCSFFCIFTANYERTKPRRTRPQNIF